MKKILFFIALIGILALGLWLGKSAISAAFQSPAHLAPLWPLL